MFVIFEGGCLAYAPEVGEDFTLECPSTSSAGIVWWHNNERLVLKGEVSPAVRHRVSFNNTTGALTIHGARLADSGTYYCGSPFDDKPVINVTVVGN